MRNRINLLMAILAVCTLRLQAQIDPQINYDLRNLLANTQENGIQVKIKYEVFDSKKLQSPIETSTITYASKGNEFFIDNKTASYFYNKEFSLIVYKLDKKLVFNRPEKKQDVKLDLMINDSSWLEVANSVTLLSDSDNIRTYQILFKKDSPFSEWELKIDTKANRLIQNVMYYSQSLGEMYGQQVYSTKGKLKPILVIQYINPLRIDTIRSDMFYANTIAQVKRNKVTVNSAYKNYHLVNYLNVNK